LDSVLAQTFQDFEIICVDDGSTDKSLDILNEYQSKEPRLIVLQQDHAGAGEARNLGIKFSKGDYLQFLDSDDYFEPTMLEELYNHARAYGSDLVVCSSRKVDETGNIIESQNPNSPINLSKVPLEQPFCWKDYKEDIFSLITPVPWNKLYKKELITDNNIKFPRLNICEDVTFVHSCVVSARKIVVFNEELINYRYNRPNSMATYRTKYTIDIVYSCKHLKDFLIKKGLYTELETAFIKAFKNHICWEVSLCSDEEYKNFLEEFKQVMPEDWKNFRSVLRKDYITPDFLNKIIGNKKVMLWGASVFIQNVLSKERTKNPNILGIIDKNIASWGKKCGNYKIYPPEEINRLNPDGIIMTILSNYDLHYKALKEEFKTKYPNTELMPNIFEEDLVIK
jgi:glycosyltransferase involved in cell wall biosynthesis